MSLLSRKHQGFFIRLPGCEASFLLQRKKDIKKKRFLVVVCQIEPFKHISYTALKPPDNLWKHGLFISHVEEKSPVRGSASALTTPEHIRLADKLVLLLSSTEI